MKSGSKRNTLSTFHYSPNNTHPLSFTHNTYMLNIQRFVCNMLQENCYIVSDETLEAVIIDCGAYFKDEGLAITNYIDSHGLKPKHLLCTHGHFDHCMGNELIYNRYGLKPEVAIQDQWLMETMASQIRDITGVDLPLTAPPVGRYLTPSDIISFGTHHFTILPTPGHTPGSVLFHCEDESVVFSGDTLFYQSIGRTDFDRGSYADMVNSLRNVVCKLPDNTIVYSGHGPKTTIVDEKTANPYLLNL